MARIPLVVACFALIAFACGGGNEDLSTADVQLEVTADEFMFSPTAMEYAAGSTVGLTMINTGELEHYWVILEEPVSTEAEIDDAEILFEMEAHGGDTVTKLFESDLAPGTYQVICTVEGHFDAGMVAEVLVTS